MVPSISGVYATRPAIRVVNTPMYSCTDFGAPRKGSEGSFVNKRQSNDVAVEESRTSIILQEIVVRETYLGLRPHFYFAAVWYSSVPVFKYVIPLATYLQSLPSLAKQHQNCTGLELLYSPLYLGPDVNTARAT